MRATTDDARQERADTIIRAARAIAEADGWAAVTTRRLSEAVAVSQPVLYSHFRGMSEIQAEVALQGFAELAERLAAADESPVDRLYRVCEAYLAFAAGHPALYDAMFSLPSALPFAASDTPPVMREGFDRLVAAVAPFASNEVAMMAEVLWSTLHGMVSLDRTGRLSAYRERRVAILVSLVTGCPTP